MQTRLIYRITTTFALYALVFFAFFQANKRPPFREINPFLNDPYDLIGSFATQGALFVSGLTYTRALRLRCDSAQAPRQRLILRGNLLVWIAAAVTLAGDLT